MGKRYIRFLGWLCAAALVLSGCGGLAPGDQGGSLPATKDTALIPITAAPTTAPTEPTEVTEPEEVPISLAPVTLLQSVQWSTYPQFMSLGSGNVLACRTDYEEGNGLVSYLEILNVYDDQVSRQSKCGGPRELLDQKFDDGVFVLRDTQNQAFYFYDDQLNMVDSLQVKNTNGYFSRDRKTYYYVEDRVIYRLDVESGNYGRMALEYDLRFAGLVSAHPDRDVLAAKFYLSPYGEEWGICAFDCETGKFLVLQTDLTYIWFDENGFYASRTNSKTFGTDFVYGSFDDDLMTTATAINLGNDTTSQTMLMDSGFLIWRSTDDKNPGTIVYDLAKSGIDAQMSRYGFDRSMVNAIYLEKEQLIFGLYAQDYAYLPVVIDPKVLTYRKSLSLQGESWPALVDRNAVLDYQDAVAGPELPVELAAVRQRADALESRYGVTVLMGQQVMHYWEDPVVISDPSKIAAALSTLEQALALYPTDFFKQFRNGIREGGVVFCLTGRITGHLDPVGKAQLKGQNYLVALDIQAPEQDRTIHHELWHVIEMKLSTDSFDNPRWRAANPKDYIYYGVYESGYQTLTQWTFAADGAACHFVSAYSRINSREDRASIMEAVMSSDASALMESAALREKLQMMSKAIRDTFDTKDWDAPYWERYL